MARKTAPAAEPAVEEAAVAEHVDDPRDLEIIRLHAIIAHGHPTSFERRDSERFLTALRSL